MLRTLFRLVLLPLLLLGLLIPAPAGAEEQSSKTQGATTKAKVSKASPKKGASPPRQEKALAAKGTKLKGGKEVVAANVPKKGKARQAKPTAAVVEPRRETAVVQDLRYWSNPDYSRIVLTLDRETTYEPHRLAESPETGTPPRLYIDVAGSRLGQGVKDVPIGDGLLRMARIAQYRTDTVRLVLDLDSIRDVKVFTFANPFRIIVDARGERRTEISAIKESIQAAVQPIAEARAEPAGEERAKPAPRPAIGKVRRVVVDPGHGGHDPGAMGPSGAREKDIVLQIAQRLAKRLREELGLDVVLTRSTDVFLELQERTGIANKVGADLFVSVHANAALNRNASGIETYYLNLAKTEKAAQLAAQENGTSLEKVSLLQAVLFDLMANYKLNDSAHLADEVQKALHHKVAGRYPAVKNLGVKQGPFYVLVGASMPSILVETAFLSNAKEEEHLTDAAYQDLTAEGIMEGLRAYIVSVK